MAGRGPAGPPRPAGRTLTIVVVLGVVAVLMAISPFLPQRAGVVVGDAVQVLAAASAAAACAVRLREVGRDGVVRPGDPHLRLAWGLIATGAACWAVGQSVWTYLGVVDGGAVPFPSWPDLGFSAAAVLVPSGIAVMIRAVIPTVPLLRPLLDAAIVCGAGFLLSWNLALRDVVAAGGDGVLPTALSVAYSFSDVLVVCLGLLGMSRVDARLRASLLTLGGLGLAFSDIGFVYSSAVGEFATGSVLDLGWVVGWCGFALAALVPRPSRRDSVVSRRRLLWGVLLPYLPVAALVAQVAMTPDHDRTADLGVGALVVLVLARQAVTLLDNTRLVTALSERQHELSRLAYTDSLTGLANRARFTSALDAAVSSCSPVVVAFCDVDHFKSVNDRWGHRAGDALLVVVAERLRAAVPGSLVARMGGDEFAVLVTGDDAAADEDGAATLELLRRHLAPPVGGGVESRSEELVDSLLGEPLHVSTGVVTSVAPRPAQSGPAGVRAAAEQLLHAADAQMYRVKRSRPHGERRGAGEPEPARPARTTGSTPGG